MKNKLKLSLYLLLFLGLSNLQAQEVIPVTGGEAGGNSGSASYTVGQIVYTTQTGTNGHTVAEGVQQPYEISVVTGIPEARDIRLSLTVYPNPATDHLTVKVENYEIANLHFLVFNMNGELLQQVKATGKETTIPVLGLSPGSYFVKVLDNKKEIKVFKIIKY